MEIYKIEEEEDSRKEIRTTNILSFLKKVSDSTILSSYFHILTHSKYSLKTTEQRVDACQFL